jgi:MinD-like ATPase involved in chromosome partitioning or flagellar assembly
MTDAGQRAPLTAGAAGWADRQRLYIDLDRRVRTPLPTSRRVSVLSLAGGTGASSVAAAVAALAAARSGRPVLAVDAHGSTHGLAAKLGWEGGERRTATNALRERARTLSEATSGLTCRGSLHFLGLGHENAAVWPADVVEWRDAVAPIGRFFPLLVTDWGRRRELAALAEIARASHSVCLVAAADRRGLEEAAALVPAMRAQPGAPDVTLALVDVSGAGASATRVRLGSLDAPVLRVPFDPRLASGIGAGRRTRRAWLAIAATVIAGRALDASQEVAS